MLSCLLRSVFINELLSALGGLSYIGLHGYIISFRGIHWLELFEKYCQVAVAAWNLNIFERVGIFRHWGSMEIKLYYISQNLVSPARIIADQRSCGYNMLGPPPLIQTLWT